jgi:hypothetical protein
MLAHYLKLSLFCLIAITFLTVQSHAGHFEEGMVAYGAGDNVQAAKSFEFAADEGVLEAYYNLGLLYMNGQGVPQDHAKAAEYFQPVAEQGSAAAQYNLGLLYMNGSGVKKDPPLAAVLYKKAADQGLPQAQYNLGYMYMNGIGVEKDPSKAIALVTEAAEKGLAQAQGQLGSWYIQGVDVQKNLAEARKWLQKAADQGLHQATHNLKLLEEVEKNEGSSISSILIMTAILSAFIILGFVAHFKGHSGFGVFFLLLGLSALVPPIFTQSTMSTTAIISNIGLVCAFPRNSDHWLRWNLRP